MIGEKETVIPEQTRSHAVKTCSLRRKDNKKTKSKYRWVWMMKNEDEMYWREYVKSVIWFDNYLSCKENALEQDLNLPSCAAARLYVEIKNNDFFNVVEVLRHNDPEEEEYFADDEEEEEDDGTVKYCWEWQIRYPKNMVWQPYMKSNTCFSNLQQCKDDVKNVSLDVVWSAALRLCIQIWHGNECILEMYYNEGEL